MKTGGRGIYDKPSQNSNYVTGVYYIYVGRHVFGGGGVCEMFPKFPTFVHHLFSVCSSQPIALAIPSKSLQCCTNTTENLWRYDKI